MGIFYIGYRGVWHLKPQTTLGTTKRPTLCATRRPTLIPEECITQMPLLQIVADDGKDGEQCGTSVSVLFYQSIIVSSAPNYAKKGRAYLYRRDSGAWKYHQTLQASKGSDIDHFGSSVVIYEKLWLLEHPIRMVIFLTKGHCMHLRCREKYLWRIKSFCK